MTTKTQEKYLDKIRNATWEAPRDELGIDGVDEVIYSEVARDILKEALQEQEEELKYHKCSKCNDERGLLFCLDCMQEQINEELQAQASKFEEVLTEYFESNMFFKIIDGEMTSYNMGILDELLEALNSSKENHTFPPSPTSDEKDRHGDAAKMMDRADSSVNESNGKAVSPQRAKYDVNQKKDKNPTSLELTNHRSNEGVGVSNLCICGHERDEHEEEFCRACEFEDEGVYCQGFSSGSVKG